VPRRGDSSFRQRGLSSQGGARNQPIRDAMCGLGGAGLSSQARTHVCLFCNGSECGESTRYPQASRQVRHAADRCRTSITWDWSPVACACICRCVAAILPTPPHCPVKVLTVRLVTWQRADPSRRPHFSQLSMNSATHHGRIVCQQSTSSKDDPFQLSGPTDWNHVTGSSEGREGGQ
jgi:hypothetical protein